MYRYIHIYIERERERESRSRARMKFLMHVDLKASSLPQVCIFLYVEIDIYR